MISRTKNKFYYCNYITPWLATSVQFLTLNDHLYFENTATRCQQIITPQQYANTINYVSVKLSKEIAFGRFALDNTILYQKAGQRSHFKCPEIVTSSFYYTNYCLKALFLQTGITLNYFTKYLCDYNP
jgi:hypothetical protein